MSLTNIDNNFLHDDIYIKDVNYKIGKNNAIDKGFYCTVQLIIGNYNHISPYVTCIGSLKSRLELCGFNNLMAGSRIICGSDRFDSSGLFGAMIPEHLKGKQMIEPVILEEFSNVGTNAIVFPGAILRRGVLLTAGSVLFGDTEEWGVYKGNPASLVKKIDPTILLKNARELGYKG